MDLLKQLLLASPAMTSTAALTSASVATSPLITFACIQPDASPSETVGRLREKFPAVPVAVTVCRRQNKRTGKEKLWSLVDLEFACKGGQYTTRGFLAQDTMHFVDIVLRLTTPGCLNWRGVVGTWLLSATSVVSYPNET